MTNRSTFFLITAVVEIATGAALLAVPALVLAALLGVLSPAADTVVVARILGTALVAIGVTCALARGESRATDRAVLMGIVVYDVLVTLVLAFTGASLGMAGPALWSAVALHTLLALWGMLLIVQQPTPATNA